MNTLRHYTRMSAAMRQLVWTAAVLLALTARGAADGTTAGPRPPDSSPVAQSEVWLCAGQRQDYGDYDQVVRIVLEKLRAADIPLDGVTVDNPYEYLVGEHFSVKLADPKSVDWLHNRLYLSAHPTATGCGACPLFQQASTACR